MESSMRKLMYIMTCLLSFSFVYASPVKSVITPQRIITLGEISENIVARYESSGNTGVISWYFTSDAVLCASIIEPTVGYRVFAPNFSTSKFYESVSASASNPYIGIGAMTTSGTNTFSIRSEKSGYKADVYKKTPNEKYLYAIRNVVLFYNNDVNTTSYSCYIINDGNIANRLDHAATVDYVKKYIPELEVKGQILCYKGNPLIYRFPISQVDDDGNIYTYRTIYNAGTEINTIESTNDKNDFPSFFDNEGNFWQMDFTKDEAKHPILLYAGRDWGYKEPPKKAITTDSGLRIRLRATTDAFVLGSLDKNQAITILKTGEKTTIGGITSPWYRIKTKDGLIGWAFGGYIKITE
jgi:hypothetical protein